MAIYKKRSFDDQRKRCPTCSLRTEITHQFRQSLGHGLIAVLHDQAMFGRMLGRQKMVEPTDDLCKCFLKGRNARRNTVKAVLVARFREKMTVIPLGDNFGYLMQRIQSGSSFARSGHS